MADESNQLRVRLVTPERVLFEASGVCGGAALRSRAIWKCCCGHAPLLAELGAGDVVVHGGAGENVPAESRYNVSWGFVEVLPDRVTILASDALKPEEIDVKRAKEQLERGHKEWNEAGDSEEAYTEALHVIAEAKRVSRAWW